MAEVSVREQIKLLVDLQAIDSQIFSLKKEQEDIPKLILELENNFEEKKGNLKALEERVKETQVKLKAKELELQSKEESIKKSQAQLYLIKTNKEYQAKLSEIGGLNADKSVLEEKIIQDLDELESLRLQAEKENSFLKAEEEKFNQEKKKYEARLKDVEALLIQLDSKRKLAIPNIDNKILANYERVLNNRSGLALVPVKNNACQGCFMNLPPQVINEIKMHDRIVVCEVCTRILYIEEEI